MAIDCGKFNSWLFRRTPDFDKELARDRHPFSYLYSTMYPVRRWESFTGTTHTWDKVHVTRPNGSPDWAAMDADACAQAICDPPRKFTGWGSTRGTYTKYRQVYQSPVFCFDQLRHIEEAKSQLAAIIAGHKKLPDLIVSDFIRQLAMRSADVLYIAGAAGLEVTVTAAMFLANGDINLGGTANLPTSKLTMNYLDNHIEDLQYAGYFDGDFLPTGKFAITADLQTQKELSNANPALTQMYNAADFAKGGKFYAYGVMSAVGNWMFKIDPEPARYQHTGLGVLKRVWPYENVAATIGKKPQFSDEYKNAKYQLFHVYNRASRTVEAGDITSVHPEMKFGLARSLMGKWSWHSPDYFKGMDPNSGTVCEFQNDLKNKGYFVGEFELGVKTTHPDIEMMILAQREPACVTNSALCVNPPDWNTSTTYQSLLPYNDLCTVGGDGNSETPEWD